MSIVNVMADPSKRCHWLLAPGLENVFHTSCGHAILPNKPYPTKCNYCQRSVYPGEEVMTTDKRPELRPCPFCGGCPTQGTEDDPRIIVCDECGLTMAGEYSIEKQRNYWNARSPEFEAMERDAKRYRWLKSATKAEYLIARGVFGLDDAAIDAAMRESE